ncbi:MAG TPA: VOC family protein [Solirubrobacterales bacterium]|nr:VOC family protein [Solirubrobacterales bacterium]
MSILGIDHVQLVAPPDCEAEARRFFGQVLGLREIERPPSLGGRGGVWFRAGEQQIHVGVQEGFVPASKAHPALLVDSAGLEDMAGRLEQAGAPVTWDDRLAPLRRFYTTDPWGNRIELVAAR